MHWTWFDVQDLPATVYDELLLQLHEEQRDREAALEDG